MMIRLVILMSCLASAALGAAEVTVDFGAERFSPARVVLRVGDILKVTRAANQPVTATLAIRNDAGMQDEVAPETEGSWQYEFTQPGRYEIFVREEPSVSTSIVVFSDQGLNADLRQEMVSYGLGYDMGRNLANDVENLDLDLFTAGITHAYRDRDSDPKLSRSEIEYIVAEFGREIKRKAQLRQDKVAVRNLELSNQFLAQNAQAEDVIELPSGLQYKFIKRGVGRRPQIGSTVTVNYRMSLLNGGVLDSTETAPAKFPLTGDVLGGFAEGLELMSVGAILKLYIPPHLAYGVRGQSGVGPDNLAIEPNAMLIFDVELLAVDP